MSGYHTGKDRAHKGSLHASEHTDGTDDIQSATTGQKGLMTATQATALANALPKTAAVFAAATELTISSGSVTVTQSVHTIDGEGDAADDLDTISGGSAEQLLLIRPASADRDITLKHGTGNIITPSGNDYTMPDNGLVMLHYDGANWRIIAPGSGGSISEVVDDTSPQLGGDLDCNGKYITGQLLKTVEAASTGSLAIADIIGCRVTNYAQAAENTQTLGACVAEASFILQIETAGAGAFHLKAGASDKFHFDDGSGTVTALDDGDKISFATPAVGDTLVVNSIRTGASDYDWLAVCTRGTATDGGA